MKVTIQSNGYFKITDNDDKNIRFLDTQGVKHNECDKIYVKRWGKNAYQVIENWRGYGKNEFIIDCKENAADVISELNRICK